MIGNNGDYVVPNAEELNKDLKKYGLTAAALCKKLGKNDTYIHNVFSRERVMRSTMEPIEECMFREHGSYCTELDAKKEGGSSNNQLQISIVKELVTELSSNDALWGAIDSTIAGSYCRTTKLFEGIEKAIRETQLENKKLLEAILQKEKEICTLNARLLATWEVNKK